MTTVTCPGCKGPYDGREWPRAPDSQPAQQGTLLSRQPTIKDVAARAGVSFKTVSRVLNGEPHVREEIRERVTAASAELGYSPNIVARGLIGAPSRLIGFLYDNPNYAYVTEAELGALLRCRQAGYQVAIEPIELAADPGRQLEGILTSLRLDGLILTPPTSDSPEVLDVVERLGVRAVRIAPGSERPGLPSVLVDDEAGAFAMTESLIRLGHSRIGFVKGHPGHGAAELRLKGYRHALETHGLAYQPGYVTQGQFTFESGFEAGRGLLGAEIRPTAIFAANDMMALGVMAAARDVGLDIPGQVSVAGFDDSRAAQMCWPELTTVRQPISDMAAAAAGMLIGAASGNADAYRSVSMKTQLVQRGSTAPPG